jgi:tRNA pseudouridine38-40 synthase
MLGTEPVGHFLQHVHGFESCCALVHPRMHELEQCRDRLGALDDFSGAPAPALVHRQHGAQRAVDDQSFEMQPDVVPFRRNAKHPGVLCRLLPNVGEPLPGQDGETDRGGQMVDSHVRALDAARRRDRVPVVDGIPACVEREEGGTRPFFRRQLFIEEAHRDVEIGGTRQFGSQRGERFWSHTSERVWRLPGVLSIAPETGNLRGMADRTVQLVLHYDGAQFAGWQRQPVDRTVQGELERVFERLMGTQTPVIGAGRTDAGVHARGQAAHVRVADRWTPAAVQRAANALLPADVWIAAAHAMDDRFHARYSAVARSYTYLVGTDAEADSPFRRRYEWHRRGRAIPDLATLQSAAHAILGEHVFRGFAVRGTAPETDDHRCIVTAAEWRPRTDVQGFVFTVTANRFLHHMVRFLVGTMMDVAAGRRSMASFHALLTADTNRNVSPPAPPHALYLDRVTYPSALYQSEAA